MMVKSTCWRMAIVHKDGGPPTIIDCPDSSAGTVIRAIAALSRDYRLTDADLGRAVREIDKEFFSRRGYGFDGSPDQTTPGDR